VQLDGGTTVVAVAHNGEAAADVETAEVDLPGELVAPVETGAGSVDVSAPEGPVDTGDEGNPDDVSPDDGSPGDGGPGDGGDETTEPPGDEPGNSDEETDA
jgi:hypothetical protein